MTSPFTSSLRPDRSHVLAPARSVDDHPSTRDGLIARIQLEADMAVCGEAADVAEAFALVRETRPDIVVVDVSLKTGNGLELIKLISAEKLKTRTLVWSMYEDSLYAERALRAGAMGYINKKHATGAIIEAIRKIMSGEVYLSAETSCKLLNRIVLGKKTADQSPTEALSDRELQTFNLIGRGLNTTDIAERMKLSPKTVETYRARIKEKLSLDDMAALTREAVQWVIEHS